MKQAITRRRILRSAAAAGTFTILGPHLVRGAAANSKIELGVVGCGGRGAWIAGLFARNPGYHISAVADYFQPVADRAGDALGVAKDRRFSGLLGYKRLLEAKVDAIALETPPWFFPRHVVDSVNAGVHVYMAKPVACDVPGTLQVLEAGKKARANSKCFLVDFQMRTDPHNIEVVRRIHEGALERVCAINSFYNDEGFADPAKTPTIESRLQQLIWVNDNDLGGGYFVNAGIHAIDTALWIANRPPVSAVGQAARTRRDPHGDSDDVFAITYDFGDGLICSHRGEHVHNLNGFSCGCTVMGRGAFAETNYAGKAWLRGGKQAYKGGDVENLYEAGAVRNIAAFHKAVTEGDYSNPTLEPSINSNLAVILGRDACRKGRKITWDELLADKSRLDVDLSGLRE